MTWDEYNLLFHKQQLNLVAFKRLMDCDEEVLRLVNSAIEAEREACAEVCKKHADVYAGLEQNPTTQSAWAACIDNRDAIRARGQA
jgi:hypothetical protein